MMVDPETGSDRTGAEFFPDLDREIWWRDLYLYAQIPCGIKRRLSPEAKAGRA